jgi:general stress protein 26
MSADGSETAVPPKVLEYLAGQKALTLATASPTGLPHAATMVYANDDLGIYLWSRPDTLTARHIEQNPAVSFTVGEYTDDWSQTKGIQASGEAHVLLDPTGIEHAIGLFEQKFPSISNTRSPNLAFFRITPTQLSFIDNESAGSGSSSPQALGFGYNRDLVFSVFRDLPRHEVDTLAAKLNTVTVEAGAVIVRQGAPADKFFIIVDGEVEVVRGGDDGEEALATLSSGQFFGEMAILRDMPRTATVRALTPTTLLTMARGDFRDLVAQSLATTQDFDTLIQQRFQVLDG